MRLSQKPFWTGQETEDLQFESNSINVRVENQGGNVIGIIQFYNLFAYEFILVEGYGLPPSAEVAMRFTPGLEPIKGFKAQADCPLMS